MRHRVQVAVVAVLIVLRAASAPGQEPRGWLGQRVITRFGTPLKIGRQVVDDGKGEPRSLSGEELTLQVYRVEYVRGP
jgi:hypothetical protein